MSILQDFASQREGPTNKTFTTRVTEHEYTQFKARCEKLGMSPSEGIRFLIKAEIEAKVEDGK